jgi:subtilase family serine protease
MSVTIALSLPELNKAEELLNSRHTPGNPQYHQFLTAEEFAARFAPKNATVARVIAGLAKYGLTAERTSATTLKVTGQPADMERAFGVSLHRYEVPPHGRAMGYTFHAPTSHPTIPGEISGSVAAVVGLDSRPSLRPMHDVAPPKLAKQRAVPSTSAGNTPGFWTVTDFANHYNVQPLYNRGVTGKGRTLGIITLASFTPSDAFAYWSALGLSVDGDRIHIVNIDGGAEEPSDKRER